MKPPKETELPPIDKSKLTPAELARVEASTAKLLEADKELAKARQNAKAALASGNPEETLKARNLFAAANKGAEEALAEAAKTIAETRQAIKARQAL